MWRDLNATLLNINFSFSLGSALTHSAYAAAASMQYN
jgi:hypothetical protein